MSDSIFVKVTDRCQGHGRCALTAPEIFGLDQYDMSEVINTGPLTGDLADKARSAVAGCPEGAIEIVDAP